MKSFVTVAIVATALTVVASLVAADRCRDLRVGNGTVIPLGDNNTWKELAVFLPETLLRNSVTAKLPAKISASISLCLNNENAMEYWWWWWWWWWWYSSCREATYIALGSEIGRPSCDIDAANQLVNVSHMTYPFNAVKFEYRQDSWNDPFLFNRTTVVCFCNASAPVDSNLTVRDILVVPAPERKSGSYDFSLFVDSRSCCAKKEVGPPPTPSRNFTRCKRIIANDGQTEIPLTNWANLRNTFFQARQESSSGAVTYATLNVSLCEEYSYVKNRTEIKLGYIYEIGGAEIELKTMVRDPYLNANKAVVFTYAGKERKQNKTVSATVNCRCNPFASNMQLMNNQFKLTDVSATHINAQLEVFTASCCSRPVTYSELEQNNKKETGVLAPFKRLYKFFRSWFF